MAAFESTNASSPLKLEDSLAQRLAVVQRGLDSRPWNRMVNGIEKRERGLTGKKNYVRAALRAINEAGNGISIVTRQGGLAASIFIAVGSVAGGILIATGVIAGATALPFQLGAVAVGLMSWGVTTLASAGERKTSRNLDWLEALAEQPKGTTLAEAKQNLVEMRNQQNANREAAVTRHMKKSGPSFRPGVA